MELFDLSDRVAVITGSSKGIGKAIAARMAQHGAKVVVSSRKGEACDAVRDEINRDYAANGGEAISIPAHVGVDEDLQNRLVLQVLRSLQRPRPISKYQATRW